MDRADWCNRSDECVPGLQPGVAAQVGVHGARRLAALPLRPHHERLPAPAVSRSEDAGLAGGEVPRVRLDVARRALDRLNLTEEQIATIVDYANAQVGKPYGVLKIATHLLDWCLLGIYLFRRLTQSPNYPICSHLVANAFARVGKHFGVPPGAATPDDIWDFVTQKTDKYRKVRELGRLDF